MNAVGLDLVQCMTTSMNKIQIVVLFYVIMATTQQNTPFQAVDSLFAN
jgi:hypothetical protein